MIQDQMRFKIQEQCNTRSSTGRRTRFDGKDISDRHRYHWGERLYCTDIDFALVESSAGKALAMVEYKNWHKKACEIEKCINGLQLRALADLCNNQRPRPIPMFCTVYAPERGWTMLPIALNRAARACLNGRNRMFMSERDYVKMLVKIRGDDLAAFTLTLNGLNKLTQPW